ncbi:MAG: YibE/F family protein [Corynebacterium sp.]|nr:YibE/F family protein [Corynebacterium sp.]
MAKHAHAAARNPFQPFQIAVAGFLALATLATVIGMIVLWPAQDTPEVRADFSFNQPHIKGEVQSVDNLLCDSPATGTEFDTPPLLPAVQTPGDCERALVTLENGRMTQLVHYGVTGEPDLSPGDKIVLSDSGDTYAFADFQREGTMWAWSVLTLVVIIAFAWWHGVRAIVGLTISLGLVYAFLLPGLMSGQAALPLSIVTCAAIVLVVVPLVHGINWKSASAVSGSLLALGIAAVLTQQALATSRLQGLSDDNNLKLLLYLPEVSILGVLMCGFIVGALGGLNDVAIAQASTVTELADADPAASPLRLFLSAMKVGRDHIASMVYTLVLTYVGATLPLLLLIAAAGRTLGQTLTSDVMATELLRSSVGALALIMAVPLTTMIAALTVRAPKPQQSTLPPASEQPLKHSAHQ